MLTTPIGCIFSSAMKILWTFCRSNSSRHSPMVLSFVTKTGWGMGSSYATVLLRSLLRGEMKRRMEVFRSWLRALAFAKLVNCLQEKRKEKMGKRREEGRERYKEEMKRTRRKEEGEHRKEEKTIRTLMSLPLRAPTNSPCSFTTGSALQQWKKRKGEESN